MLWRIEGTQSVVGTSLVVEGHVFGRAKILRISLCYVPSGVGAYIHAQTVVHTATLGGDEYGSLGGAAAIEHHSLSAFEEGHFFDFRGQHVVGIARHTVDEHQVVGETPHTCAVEAGYVALHVVKTIGIIVLVHQFSVVQAGDATHDVFFGNLFEQHVDLGGISSIYLGFNGRCNRQSQES